MFLICTNCHFSCAALVWRILWIFSFCLVFSFNTNVHSLSFSAILILAFFPPSSWFNCSCSSELPLSPPHFNGSARLYALDWDVLEHIAVLSVSDSSGWFTVPWDLLSTLWCPLWVSLVSGRRWVCVLCLVYWAPGRLGLARHRTRTPFSHTQTGPLILLSALSLFITQITQKPDACSCCLPGPFSHSFSLSPTSLLGPRSVLHSSPGPSFFIFACLFGVWFFSMSHKHLSVPTRCLYVSVFLSASSSHHLSFQILNPSPVPSGILFWNQ